MIQKSSLSFLVLLTTLTGCATLGGRGPERIAIDSSPSGADVQVDCPSGPKSSGVTPTSVLIPRGVGDCEIVVARMGFKTQRIVLEQGYNSRYWLNIPPMVGLLATFALALSSDPSDTHKGAVALVTVGALGGAGLIIDSITEAKLDHDPKKISVALEPDPSPPRE